MSCFITELYGDKPVFSVSDFTTSDIEWGGIGRTEVNTSTVKGQADAYMKSATLQDAIDMKASYHSSLKISAIDDKGNWLDGDTGTPSQIATIKKDLLLIKRFNPQESFVRFNHRLKTMLHIFGEAYVWKQKIPGFNKYDYYILPNDVITPKYSGLQAIERNFERKVDYYEANLFGSTLRLEKDEIFKYKDRLLRFGKETDSLSRLNALKEPISTLLSMGQMLTQLLADGGARGIIGQGARDIDMISAPFLSKEKAEIQRELKKYGLMRGQLKYIVTKGAASYVPLTSKIVDMQLPEIALDKKIDIYRAFGIPTAFAVNESRFKVLPEARKELFTSSVIPEGEDLFGEEIRMVGMPERDWLYKPDWSHMDFFQESLKESGVALQQAANGLKPLVEDDIITREQALTYLMPYLR